MDASAERRRGWWRPVVTVAGIAVVVIALLAGINLSRVSAIDTSLSESEPQIIVEPSVASSPSMPSSGGSSQGGLRVSAAWAQQVSDKTGIPQRALLAYARADLTLRVQNPACHIGWNTVAAIGAVESAHGSHGGARLDAAGRAEPVIRGPRLDGSRSARIADSDRGSLDGDSQWDRAVGPMQFLPATWRQWGRDADGDGVADPDQIDDAALTAAEYLCSAGGSVNSASGWTRAIWAYNHSSDYVDRVRSFANAYAAAVS